MPALSMYASASTAWLTKFVAQFARKITCAGISNKLKLLSEQAGPNTRRLSPLVENLSMGLHGLEQKTRSKLRITHYSFSFFVASFRNKPLS